MIKEGVGILTLENEVSSKKKKAKIVSDAYPRTQLGEQVKLPCLASIHKLIADNNLDIKLEEIKFMDLRKEDYEELVCLHKEWFPVKYDKNFFEIILNCKLNDLDVLKSWDDGELKSKSRRDTQDGNQSNYNYNRKEIFSLGGYISFKGVDYLVACVTVEIQDSVYFEANCNIDVEYSNDLENIPLLNKGMRFAYIMTLGVINEIRRLGVSRLLLEKMKEKIEFNYNNVYGYFLHVIEYNETAINFYKKNNFVVQRKLNNYYNIKETTFNALVLFQIWKKDKTSTATKIVTTFLLPFKLLLYVILFGNCFVCRRYLGRKSKLKIN